MISCEIEASVRQQPLLHNHLSTEIPEEMMSAVRNSNGAGILTRLNIFEYGLSQCPLCNFTALSLQTIISHIRTVHSSDKCFKITCGLEGCAASTYKSFSALYSHLYRHHQWFIKKRKGETAESEVELSSSGEAGADPQSFINNTTLCSIFGAGYISRNGIILRNV